MMMSYIIYDCYCACSEYNLISVVLVVSCGREKTIQIRFVDAYFSDIFVFKNTRIRTEP